MAEYRKIDWKVKRVGNQIYIQDNVVRKPKFEENPEIEYGHSNQREVNRERRRNKEFAQAMNRRYIGFLIACAMIVFGACAAYLHEISRTTIVKDNIKDLEAQVSDLKSENDERQTRMDADVNPEEIRRQAVEELGMVYAGREHIVDYSYEESDYVRQYEDIPKK